MIQGRQNRSSTLTGRGLDNIQGRRVISWDKGCDRSGLTRHAGHSPDVPARDERGYDLMTENLVDCKWVDHDVGIIIRDVAVNCSKRKQEISTGTWRLLKNSKWC